MKLIDLLNKISNNEIEPPLYFSINTLGHNFIIEYLYYSFTVREVYTSFNRSLFEKGFDFSTIMLSSLNKKIYLLEKKDIL